MPRTLIAPVFAALVLTACLEPAQPFQDSCTEDAGTTADADTGL